MGGFSHSLERFRNNPAPGTLSRVLSQIVSKRTGWGSHKLFCGVQYWGGQQLHEDIFRKRSKIQFRALRANPL